MGPDRSASRKGVQRKIRLSVHAPAIDGIDVANRNYPLCGAVYISLECGGKLGVNIVPAITPYLHVNGEKYVHHFVAPSRIFAQSAGEMWPLAA